MHPIVPWYATPVVLIVAVTIALWLYHLIATASNAADLAPETRARVRRLSGLFLGSWLGLAFVLAPSTPAVDAAGRGLVPTTFLFFGGITLTLAIGLLAWSPTWRKVVDAIPADRLISAQVYRAIGAALFLPLYAMGSLPGYFALPAGWGDLAVALMAPFVALAVRRQAAGARPLALGWNLFGFVDLVVAVGLGTGWLVNLLGTGGGPVSTASAMTFYPLVLIPTFAVPLGFILHIYSIRRTVSGEQGIKRGAPAQFAARGATPISSSGRS
jgi:hypothetical protein